MRERAVVASIGGKARRLDFAQVRVRKTNASEPPLTRRKNSNRHRNQGRFTLLGQACQTPGLLGRRRPALSGRDSDLGSRLKLREPVVPMPREKLKRHDPRGESAETEHWGGPACRSDDGH